MLVRVLAGIFFVNGLIVCVNSLDMSSAAFDQMGGFLTTEQRVSKTFKEYEKEFFSVFRSRSTFIGTFVTIFCSTFVQTFIMLVHVLAVILFAIGLIVSVNSLEMSSITFDQMGGSDICDDSNRNMFRTICSTVIVTSNMKGGECYSIPIKFSNQTVNKNVLVCVNLQNEIVGCAYADRGKNQGFSTMNYHRGEAYCY